ncbi:MAG: hypothetical protein JNK54_00745 [Elusimicrobia bacterium]|jgi:hypothetical protein|nr:hypothetical protein [Elusimicrobiota bacterium]
MSLELYIAILLTVVVLSIVVGTVALVVVLLQLKRAARSVERVVERTGDQIGQLGEMAGSLGQVALGIAGAMGKKTVVGAGLLYNLFQFFRHRRKKDSPSFEEEDKKDDGN